MRQGVTILDYLQFDTPTRGQKDVLLAMSDFVSSDNSDDFLILTGAAGTGKTSITTALIGYLNSKGLFYKIAAPTGRAARILGRKCKTVNSTIHSMIYNTSVNNETGEVRFVLKPNQVEDLTIFLIDEASMINSVKTRSENSLFSSNDSLLNDLIKFIKTGNKENKVIFLGDRNQLPPINESDSKALSQNFIESNFKLTGSAHHLDEVKRQEDGSYILKNATGLRRAIEEGKQHFNLSNVGRESFWNACDSYIQNFNEHGFDNVVSIGATHKMNMAFNRVVRKKIYGDKANVLEKEDLLILTQTWKRNGVNLYSGDHVIIKSIDLSSTEFVAGLKFVPVTLIYKDLEDNEEELDDYLLIDSVIDPKGITREQEGKLRHERFKKNKIFRESGNPSDDRYVGAIRATYGHSITCNKAQGGEWNKVLLNSFYMPTLRYQYTAITRAKKDIILY
ncbi:helicase [Gilvibacter sp. SZ-19]|uniref:ATP-dependent DNA helicase n=1 Tax=Gilvibacter sp. SZ-19 TaxID=754429 RepID=UPI000B3C6461|nr:AAA family ATPase [Gilvibacter sp. SZ-19]ARV12012.1 helicase [Gilvibacter sp. SZ-19]